MTDPVDNTFELSETELTLSQFDYQWQSATVDSPANYSNIPGATNRNYVTPSGFSGYPYIRVVVTRRVDGVSLVSASIATGQGPIFEE